MCCAVLCTSTRCHALSRHHPICAYYLVRQACWTLQASFHMNCAIAAPCLCSSHAANCACAATCGLCVNMYSECIWIRPPASAVHFFTGVSDYTTRLLWYCSLLLHGEDNLLSLNGVILKTMLHDNDTSSEGNVMDIEYKDAVKMWRDAVFHKCWCTIHST